MGIFSEIPLHNQMDVLKKLNFKDFVKFKQCSKETVEITTNFKYRLPLKVFMILIKYDSFRFELETYTDWRGFGRVIDEPVCMHVWDFNCHMKLSDDYFAYLEKFCHSVKLIVKNLAISEKNNSAAMTDKLINLLNPHTLHIFNSSSAYLRSLKELPKIQGILFNCGVMEESDFLLLQAPEIDVDSKYKNSWLNSSAVNKFLKQWYEGERQIKNLVVQNLDYPYIAIYEDLNFSTLWSPKPQEQAGPFYHIMAQAKKKPFARISSLTRADGKKLFVGTYQDCDGTMVMVAREYQEYGEVEKCIQKIIDNLTPIDITF